MLRSASEIDKEGRNILRARLRELGWTYQDVDDREGYDGWVSAPGGERKRVEVKSGKKGGWLHIDVRRARKARWNDGSEKDEPLVSGLGPNPTVEVKFDLAALPFDEVFIVQGVGMAEPTIYQLTRNEILQLPRTRLSYKGFLIFSFGTPKDRELYRWPRARS